jgi:hypothetical protein
MNDSFTIESAMHFQRRGRGASKELRVGQEQEVMPQGGVSRVARLMALAIRFEGLVRTGAVTNYADLARLGQVTRARISQIANLLHLAPDIQQELLFWRRPPRGRDPLHLARLQPIAAAVDWKKQRRLWGELVRGHGAASRSLG